MTTVANPASPICVLLVLAIPGIWAAGRTIGGRVAHRAALASLLAPGIGLGAWLLAVHVIALGANSFPVGLWAGTATVAIAGAVSWRSATRREGARQRQGERYPASMWVTAVLSALIVAPAAFGWALEDEVLVTGHMSIAAQIQSGFYPPRHLTFPAFELRYHYLPDLLTAILMSLFRIRVDTTLDLMTLGSWAYTWCLLWALGEELVGAGRGILTSSMTLFGGGFPFLCDGPMVSRLLSDCRIVGVDTVEPISHWFFGNPWKLGFVFALCALLVFHQRSAASTRWRFGTIGLLWLALDLSQFALFLSLMGAMVATDMWAGAKAGKLEVGMAVTAALVLAVATRLGGFFAPSPSSAGWGIVMHIGHAGALANNLIWHLGSFGMLLPLGVAGLFLLRSDRLLYAALAGGGLLMINTFEYQFSWDIVKFAVVAGFALSVSSSAAVARLLTATPKSVARMVAGLAIFATVAPGLLFPVTLGLGIAGITYDKTPEQLSEADVRAVEWLRGQIAPGEIVYRRYPVSLAYAQWGGLPSPWVDDMVSTLGFPPGLILPRRALFHTLPHSPNPVASRLIKTEIRFDPAAYLGQGVRWFVIEAGDDLEPVVQNWLRLGKARVRATFGPLEVVELEGDGTPASPQVSAGRHARDRQGHGQGPNHR